MAKKTINFVVHYNQTSKDIYKDFNFPSRPKNCVINSTFEYNPKYFKYSNDIDGIVVNALGLVYRRDIEKLLKHTVWLAEECKVKYIEFHTSDIFSIAILDEVFSTDRYNKLFHKVENSISEKCTDEELYKDFNHL